MESTEIENKFDRSQRRGKITAGLFVVAAGVLFLARELGAEIPAWIFSWKIILVVIGLVIAIKHRLRHPGWILFFIGGGFLLNDIYPEFHLKPIMWPVLIILLGLFIIFKPRRRHHRMENCKKKWQADPLSKEYFDKTEPSNEDLIDSTVFMAGVKKNIISKNFRGGELTNIFGGTELNLSQADFEGTARLEVTQVFGGTKLIIPANWEIRSELVTVFGSVEDKRANQPVVNSVPAKILHLTGTTFCGGLEIGSF